MKTDIFLLITVIYFLVFFKKIYQIISIQPIYNFKEQDKKLLCHLLLDALLWPIVSALRYNPLEAISFLFFSRYGDKGHLYFGSKGLKNFLNDTFKGRDRYASLKKAILVFEIDKDCQFFKENPVVSDMHYAQLFVGKFEKVYLYRLGMSSSKPSSNFESISRYDIDSCIKLNEQDLFQELSLFTRDPKVLDALKEFLSQ